MNSQEIMAKLILRPFDIERILGNISLVDQMNTTDKEKKNLKSFFESEGNKFYISSLLLKKRRFQNIIKLIPLSLKYFGEELMLIYWNKYLLDLPVSVSPPQSPLYELDYFVDYIIENDDDMVFREILNFERLKTSLNKENDDSNIANHAIVKLSAGAISLISNKYNNSDKVLIYKNLKKPIVTTIKINEVIEDSLCDLRDGSNIDQHVLLQLQKIGLVRELNYAC